MARNSDLSAWKLFKQRRDGTIGSLFIHRRDRLQENEWLQAECYPTKGYKVRPGWHAMPQPNAPHLSKNGRVWRQVLLRDVQMEHRPAAQGGLWYVAGSMKIRPAENVGEHSQ